jgi:hypothetical protein
MLVLASGNNLVDAPMGNPQPSLTPPVGGGREEGPETVRHAAQAEHSVHPQGNLDQSLLSRANTPGGERAINSTQALFLSVAEPRGFGDRGGGGLLSKLYVSS